MRNHSTLLLSVLVTVAAAPSPAQQQGPAQQQETWLKELNLGEYWYGTEVKVEDLRGKIVLVEYWGS